jgi:gamma-glutamyltranspeptidase/glutathione hydrolase
MQGLGRAILFAAICFGSAARVAPVWAASSSTAALATAHPLATEAGAEVLKAGGNAFDAAVAVTAALAVVEPYSSGLGGGGFWLLHRAGDGRDVVVDGRETAPLAITPGDYLDAQGKPVPRRAIDGPLAAGIPGVPAGIVHLSERYGRLPLRQTLAPAVRYAREGFPVSAIYRRKAQGRLLALRASQAGNVFLLNGEVPPLGHRIVQQDLASTINIIINQGVRGFYLGPLARRLVNGVRSAGGCWSLEDLARYRVIERAPLIGSYRGMRLVSVPRPSSGGTVLLETFNILEGYDLAGHAPVTRKHLMVEAMRRAYQDRARYLGDPAYSAAPLARLLSKDYARQRRMDLHLDRATPSKQAIAAAANPVEGPNTTHFSVVDGAGNRVAATLSINYDFGSGFVPPGTGVLLNDEMDDFSLQPGVPNVYGLVGGTANAVVGGKRPLSSMTPSFLEKDGRIAVFGTPGNSRIISMVMLGALEFAAGGTARDIVALPRFHHQFLPDEVQHEPGAFSPAEAQALRGLGHTLKDLGRQYGNMQIVIQDLKTGALSAASDPRGEGSAAVIPLSAGIEGRNSSRAAQ